MTKKKKKKTITVKPAVKINNILVHPRRLLPIEATIKAQGSRLFHLLITYKTYYLWIFLLALVSPETCIY